MFESKYSKVLTVLLIIVIIGIVGLLGFLGYDYYQKFFTDKDAKKFTDDFGNMVSGNQNTVDNTVNPDYSDAENPLDKMNSTPNGDGSGTATENTVKYKGFDVAGTIEIPKNSLKYPIITRASKSSIEVAVAVQYGPGVNNPGNTVIVGHNYRNGQFFSDNKKLNNGDVIYITDNSGMKVKYTIYNKYETTPEDTDYMIRDTAGAKEISLSTCTDDSKARLIIWAKAE